MLHRTMLSLSCVLIVAGCRSQHSSTSAADDPGRWRSVPDLPVSPPPYTTVHASFKERLEQRYVFVEARGSYADTGRALPDLYRDMRAAGIEPTGPPFALFFDDPRKVPVEALRARACIPCDPNAKRAAGLAQDVLPGVTVAYAVVSGPYPEVSQAYPGLAAYVSRMGWIQNGPTREIYLVAPDSVERYEDLLCEIQMPVGNAP